jgi:hypothetical protein
MWESSTCPVPVDKADEEEEGMTTAVAKIRSNVTHSDVLRAIKEFDRLGPEAFFAAHGYGPSRTYELVWRGRRYPHKALLGTAYEFATGHRLNPGDFEGGKVGAVSVLEDLGFTLEAKS